MSGSTEARRTAIQQAAIDRWQFELGDNLDLALDDDDGIRDQGADADPEARGAWVKGYLWVAESEIGT